jgi:hypothetical protein
MTVFASRLGSFPLGSVPVVRECGECGLTLHDTPLRRCEGPDMLASRASIAV